MAQEKEILSFQRRQVRDYTGIPDHLVRRYLETLVGMEYLLVLEGKNGVRFEYRLNPEPLEHKEIIQGLTTPEELASATSATMLADPSSGGKASVDSATPNLATTLRKPCRKVKWF